MITTTTTASVGEQGCARMITRARRLSRHALSPLVAALILIWLVPPAMAAPPNSAIRYTYDPDGELTGLVVPGSESALYSWDPAGNLLSVSRQSASSLRLLQASPTPASVGDTVTLAGTGFSATAKSDTVKFNGTPATVTEASEWQLTVKVPGGASTGSITVQTPNEGPVSSPEPFSIRASPVPTVSKFSPAKIAAGGTVTLTGSNFNASPYNQIVTVNGTKPEVLSASPTSLKIAIPQATTGGHVSVETPEGSGTAKKLLYIAPLGVEVKNIGTTAEVPSGKSKATKLSGGKTSLVLFDGIKGQRMSVLFSSSTLNYGYASLYGPEAKSIATQSFYKSGSSTLEPVTLPATGTYTLALEGSGKEAGKVTVAPTVVNDITGTLTPTAAGVTTSASLKTPGQQARYTVEGKAGQSVSVQTTKAKFSNSYYLEWLDSEGQVIYSRSFGGEEAGFLEQVKFPTSGKYTLVVNPRGQTGSLTLTAYDASDLMGTITPSAGGETKTVTISVPGQYARYNFVGTAGQRVSLGLGNSTFANGVRVSIYGPEGEELGSQYAYSGEARTLEPVALPASGTYTIWVEPSNGETGKLSLSAYAVTNVTGSITPTTAGTATAVSFTTPGQQARFTVSGAAGHAVSLEMSKVKLTNTYSLEWLDAEGNAIGSRSLSGGQDAFVEQVRFPATGTYTLVINPRGQTGSLTVTAFDASDAIGTINPTAEGETKAVAIAVPGQYARYTFSGTKGQQVSLKLAGATFSSGVRVSVASSEGEELTSRWVYPEQSIVVEPVALPSSGTYTISLEPGAGATGKVSLSAYSVTDVTGSLSPTTSGASATVTIKSPGQRARYTIAGTAGEAVSLQTTKVKFAESYRIAWLNPAGEVIENRSLPGESNGFARQVYFPTAGTYTLVIDPRGQTGSLTLTAFDASDATGTTTPSAEGDTKAVTIGVPGQFGRISFPGTKGQRVSLGLAGSTFNSGVVVSLYSPTQEQLAYRYVYNGQSASVEPVTLPVTGTYIIWLEPYEGETGKLTLSSYLVSDVSGAITPTTAGASTALAIKSPGQRALYSVSAKAGEAASVEATKVKGFSSYNLEWLDPKGEYLYGRSFGSEATGFLEQLRFPMTGTYTLVVNPQGQTGSMTLVTYNATDTTGTITPTAAGETKAITIGVPGQYARYSFPATSGQLVTFKATGVTLASGAFGVFAGEEWLARTTIANGSSPVLEVTPSATATDYVVVEPYGSTTGKLKLTAYLGAHANGANAIAAKDARLRVAPAQPSRDTGRPAAVRTANPRHVFLGATRSHGRVRATSSHRRARSQATRTPRRAAIAARHGALVQEVTAAMRTFRPFRQTAWAPSARARQRVGGLQSGELSTPWTRISRQLAGHDATAISGQVLATNGNPLVNVQVSVAGSRATATTDATGRFLLDEHVPAGHDRLVVDGNRRGQTSYGSYQIGVDVTAYTTTVLPYTVWLTPLDPAGNHTAGTSAAGETDLTTPKIPGLEVRIPAGTVITASNGKAVHKLNITPIPVDRTPFPLPPFVEVPVYFTVQPGGASLSKGAEIVYPNWSHAAAGQRIPFWNYDAAKRGWYVYGYGTVTPSGEQVVPDPGVRVWEFSGAMITGSLPPPGRGPKNGASSSGGEPVDLQTGLFVQSTKDLLLPGPIPIDIERTYRQADPNSYMFGIGTASPYDTRLWSNNNYQSADLVLPDGGDIHYVRTSPGTSYAEAVYEAKTTPGPYYHSTIRYDTSLPGWHLSLTDGITYDFGEVAPLQSIHDRYGNKITLTRENGQNGNITQITSSNGMWVKLAYEGSLVKEATDNGGRHVKYGYENGHLVSVTDAAGRVTKYAYNGAGEMTSATDPRGVKFIENEYDANERVDKQRDADGGTFNFTYSLGESGQVEATTVTEPSSSKRRVTFNEQGFPTGETDALGTGVEQKASFERDASTGRILSETDARGRKTTYVYDAYGNVTEVTRLAGTSSAQTTKYEYQTGTTHVTTEIDALGHARNFEYGTNGELLKATDALGHSTSYEYNSEGLPTTETDAEGDSTHLEYQHGNLVSAIDPLGRTSSQFVDALGRVARTTDPTGGRTHYSFDADNDVTSVIDPHGGSTTLEYSADGEITAVTDPRGGKTSVSYSPMDRVETETDPLGQPTKWLYNTSGAPVESVDRDGHHTTLEYDALGRLVAEQYGVAGGKAESKVAYEYDTGDRLTHITDTASGEYSLAYDELDRLTEDKAPTGTIAYTYDGGNRRKAMTAAGGEPVEYGYDAGDRLTEVKRGSEHVALTYGPLNNLAELTLPNGVSQHYSYDAAGEPTAIRYLQGTNTLGELDYAYNAGGQTEAMWGSYSRASLPTPVSSAAYNAANEQTAQNGSTLGYDADGNLTGDGQNEYKWNARGQLAGMSGATSASFVYNPFGQRTSKTLGGTTTKLLLDGEDPAVETEGTKAGHRFLTGFGPNQIFSRTNEGGTESYLTDTLGSTIALADSSASLKTSYTYGPFGAASSSGASSTNPFQFTGRENDGGSLQYNSARYYSSASSRFISQDPSGLTGSGTNLYQYGANDPIDFVDPSGRNAIGDFLAGGADALTFGLSTSLLNAVGVHPNTCSFAFRAGGVAAFVASAATGGGAILDAVRVARAARAAAVAEDVGAATLRHYTTKEFAESAIRDGQLRPSTDGFTYLTPDAYSDGSAAQSSLAVRNTPEGYIEMPAPDGAPDPTVISPANGSPGGGLEVPVPGPVTLPPGSVFTPF